MNVAGRTSDHPFKDLRAASRRAKRYPERIKSGNKRRRRDPMPVTRTQRNKEEAYKRIASREWEDDWDAERCHEIDLEHMDDIVEYERFGKHADIFERNDGEFVVYGENFGTWARRRIDEMRWVKEHRIHKSDKPTSDLRGTLVLPHTLRCTARPGGVMASIPTAPLARRTDTTLPTSMEDIRAHLALACVLASSKAFRHHCRRARTPSFQAIEGFGWWGEYYPAAGSSATANATAVPYHVHAAAPAMAVCITPATARTSTSVHLLRSQRPRSSKGVVLWSG
jgi:hypothetical protein